MSRESVRDQAPRAPRAVAADPQRLAAAANGRAPVARTVAALCEQFAPVCESAVDPLEIASALEFEGLGDTWGYNQPKANISEPAPNSPYWDVATGLVMLLSRFIPIIAPLALAGGLAAKKPTPFTAGTLRTDTLTFGFVLLGTVILIGALLFLPAAVLGPVAEHLGPLPFGG